MAVSKKQQACVTRYVSSHYDKITVTCPKGSRETYKAIAERLGMSVNQLFLKAVQEYADNHDIEIHIE